MRSTVDSDGYALVCPICKVHFWICSSCWRGHKYCSIHCRKTARKLCRRIAQSRYEKSKEVRMDKRDYQREYRKRNKKNSCQKISVTDHSSNKNNFQINNKPQVRFEFNLLPECQFCGTLIEVYCVKGRYSG